MARLLSVFCAFAIILTASRAVEGANILGFYSTISPSHLIIHMSMAKVLAENGHNVTVVTGIKPAVTHKDINVIVVEMSKEDEKEISGSIKEMSQKNNKNMIIQMFGMIGKMKKFFSAMQAINYDRRVIDLYENKDNKFDLVIVGFFMNNYQLGIAHKLNVPLVVSAPMPPNALLGQMVGNPAEISYVPAMESVEKGKAMTFTQRLMNAVSFLAFQVFQFVLELQNKGMYMELYGDDPTMPRYEDLTKNISMLFCASHGISEGPIQPNLPGIVEMGGIQVKDKPDPLPKNMAEFLDKAPHGGILLSLGSNVKGSHLASDTVKKMFNVLSKLKQRVIWKWEDLDNTPGKSENILYSKWLPQDDILAHPKIVLFITHAGKGGISEAQYHGKPMLALPVFGDQPTNAEKMVKSGFGLELSLLELEEEPFRESLEKVLNDPQYTDNVKRFSALYRDRPMTARQNALYWTEYVIRHHGAAHLQSPAVHMGFIAIHNLDVYALLFIIQIIIISIVVFSIRCCYKKCCSKPKKSVKKLKKK